MEVVRSVWEMAAGIPGPFSGEEQPYLCYPRLRDDSTRPESYARQVEGECALNRQVWLWAPSESVSGGRPRLFFIPSVERKDDARN